MADAIVTDVLARVSADASNFVRNMATAAGAADKFRGSLNQIDGGLNSTNQQIQQFSGTANLAHKSMMALGAVSAIAGGAMIAFGVKSFYAAAQVNEMDVAMRAVGNSTGKGYTALRQATIAVRDNGIEMAAAQQMVLLYAKANLELADAQKIARVAQDLAVLSGANSTDTAMRLTYAIMNQDTLMLRHIGITKTASDAFQEYAVANNTSAKALTESQKKQAITNMVIAEGAKVAGVYEAAMKEPAKVLRSYPRLFNEIQVAVGQGLTSAFGPLILNTYDALKAFTKLVREGGALTPILDALGRAFTYMTAPMVKGMEALKKFLKGIQEGRDVTQMYRERLLGVVGASNEMEIKTRKLAESFSQFLPIIAAVGTGLSIFFGKGLLQGIPVIGNLVGGLNPLLGALVALVLTTPPLQEALVNLFKAFAPLKEVAMGVAQIFGGIFSFAVATLIGLINGLAGVVSTVSQFLARNAEAVKIVVGTLAGMAIAYVTLTSVMNAYKTVLGIVKSVQQAYAFMTYATTVGVTGFRKAMEILNMVIAKNPIMALVIVVGVLVAAFAYAWKTSETFRNVMTQVFDQVAKVVGSVIAFVLNTLAGLLEGFANVMGQGGSLRDLFILVFNGIIKVVGFVIAGIITYFADLLDAYSKLISSSSFIGKAMRTVFTFIGDVIKTFVVYLINGFANVIGLFAGLLEAVGSFGEGFTQGFNKLGKVVFDFAKGILVNLGKLLKGVFNAAGNLVKGIVDAIKGVFKGGNNSAEEAAKNMGSWTDKVFAFTDAGAKALRGVERGLNNTAKKIAKIDMGAFAESFYTGLSNGAKTAGTFLTNIAKKITDFTSKDWGTGIADTLVAAANTAATWLRSAATSVLDFTSEGFTQNLTEGIGSFLDLVEGMFTNLKGTIGGESETLFDPITDAMDDIADGADGAAQRAAERLKRITDAAKSALSEIQKQAQEVLAFSDQVKKGINDFGGIASLSPEQGVPVTANMIIDNMRQRLAKITKFGTDLRTLAGLGLNNASLQELIQAGPIAGGAMAAALVKEGQSAVSQVNSFQSGIDLAGSAIGDIAARSQFGMGTEEAKGVIETRIEVKEGAVQIVFGSNIDSETRGDIRETVNEAIREAMAELAREIANQRAS